MWLYTPIVFVSHVLVHRALHYSTTQTSLHHINDRIAPHSIGTHIHTAEHCAPQSATVSEARRAAHPQPSTARYDAYYLSLTAWEDALSLSSPTGRAVPYPPSTARRAVPTSTATASQPQSQTAVCFIATAWQIRVSSWQVWSIFSIWTLSSMWLCCARITQWILHDLNCICVVKVLLSVLVM